MKLPLLLILLYGLSAGAVKLAKTPNAGWQKRLAAACEKNIRDKKADRRAVCACVARNFVVLAEKEKSAADTAGLLTYVEKHYALKLTPAEIEADPYFIDEHFLAVGRGCLRDVRYSLKPVPAPR